MKALVIVDVQNDFLPGGSLAVKHGDKVIPVINRIQNDYDLVVATQDWHPAGHKSFASSHEGKKEFDVIDLDGLEQTLWPDHCVQGTEGADFAPELKMNAVEAIFRKGTDQRIDSYSAFFDNGHRKSTGLADYLQGKEVNQVYLTGLASDICVYFTGMDSLQEDFETFIIQEGTLPLDKAENEKAMQEFVKRGGKVINKAI